MNWKTALWYVLAMPAMLAWAAYGVGYIADPHIPTVDVVPIEWAAWTFIAYYVCMAVVIAFVLSASSGLPIWF